MPVSMDFINLTGIKGLANPVNYLALRKPSSQAHLVRADGDFHQGLPLSPKAAFFLISTIVKPELPKTGLQATILLLGKKALCWFSLLESN